MIKSEISNPKSESAESLVSLDEPTAGSPRNEDNLERVYTRPGHTFKGRPLHPYSHGIDLLVAQVTDFENDTLFYRWVTLLFLLAVRDPELSAIEDRKRHVLPLAWHIASFRAALVEWLDQIKWAPEDSIEAERVYGEILAEACGTAVEPVGPGAKKKRAVPSRRKRPS